MKKMIQCYKNVIGFYFTKCGLDTYQTRFIYSNFGQHISHLIYLYSFLYISFQHKFSIGKETCVLVLENK